MDFKRVGANRSAAQDYAFVTHRPSGDDEAEQQARFDLELAASAAPLVAVVRAGTVV